DAEACRLQRPERGQSHGLWRLRIFQDFYDVFQFFLVVTDGPGDSSESRDALAGIFIRACRRFQGSGIRFARSFGAACRWFGHGEISSLDVARMRRINKMKMPKLS